MSFEKSQMLYNDDKYYKWSAKADHDNPNTKGIDNSELNRTEGYEVLYFINRIAGEYWKNQPVSLATYKKIGKMIRCDVPGNIRTHAKVANWILTNWNNY